jgi:hypothetical protein
VYCCLTPHSCVIFSLSLRKVSFRRDLSMQALAVKAKHAISLLQLSRAWYSVQVSLEWQWRYILPSTAYKPSAFAASVRTTAGA